MAKLKATELAKQIAIEGIQMMGARGTTLELDMVTQLHSSIVGTIMGGTSEIQREIIGKTLGL